MPVSVCHPDITDFFFVTDELDELDVFYENIRWKILH